MQTLRCVTRIGLQRVRKFCVTSREDARLRCPGGGRRSATARSAQFTGGASTKFLASVSHAANSGDTVVTSPMEWYEAEVRALEETRATQSPPPDPAVFYGSSSITLWSTLARDLGTARAVNLGFGGSTLEACVWFFERLVPPAGPASLVVYGARGCGERPHRERTPETILCRQPRRRGSLLSMPSAARTHRARQTIRTIHPRRGRPARPFEGSDRLACRARLQHRRVSRGEHRVSTPRLLREGRGVERPV